MLKDAKISTKVIIGFVITIILATVVGLIGRQAMLRNYDVGRDLGVVAMPSLYGIEEMSTGMMVVSSAQNALTIKRLSDPKVRQDNFDALDKGLRQFAEGRQLYEPLPQQPEEARTWQRAVPLFETWQRNVQHFVDLQKDKDRLLAQGAKPDDPAVNQIEDRTLETLLASRGDRIEAMRLIKEIVKVNYALSTKIVKDTEVATTHSSELIFIVLLLGALTAVVLAVVIVRGVNTALTCLRNESMRLAEAAVAGQLDARGDVMVVPAEFRSIIQGVNDTLDAVVTPLNVAADYVDKISKGNIPPQITDRYNGDFNTIKNNLNQCIDAVNLLVADTAILAKSAVEGKLATRADANKHQGDFRKIVQGVNDTLDSVIGPLNVAADYVDKISRGNIPNKITDTYHGDFNTIKNNLNQCIDAVNLLVTDTVMLAKAAVAGKLDTRADASKHQNDFRKIVQGINDTLDSVIGPLTVAADYVEMISRGNVPDKITDQYQGDFNTIKTNLNQCIEAIHQLVSDTQALSQSAVEGQLGSRADASRHSGDFRRIVEGVNKTLDAVVDPIMEATSVLESLSQYDLRARVTGNYSGDHARIKTALNATAQALHDAMVHVAESVEQLSQASNQIAASSQSVAQGSTEQASSLEETSASLEEMSGMTKQNADNTIQARTLAQSTKEAAERGGSSMSRMIDAMEKIRAASEGTAEIIKDINDIAFQTNLLALNAAVEAARAGDAGRGFAVVAEEVRNLALRSKEAAKKTEDLIKMSVNHAANGRVISGEVADSLTAIVSAAGKVNDIVSEIAVASQEQSRGIDQVNKAVSEMDKVVQTAAANAEESSSAAEELSGQSSELNKLVARFQLQRDSLPSITRREPVGADVRRRTVASLPARRSGSGHVAVAPPRHKGSNGTKRPSAEELIPFDGDPEFADF